MIQRKGYCYRFMSDKNQVLYVGKTVNMDARMKNHFSKKSHLANTDLYSKVQRIEYLTCKDEFEALQKELTYINLYKPKYNTASKIKQLIDPPQGDKWKVYKVIKHIEAHQERENYIRAKYLPLVMASSFIFILWYIIRGAF